MLKFLSAITLIVFLLSSCSKRNIPQQDQIEMNDKEVKEIGEEEEIILEDNRQKTEKLKSLQAHLLFSISKTDCIGKCPVFEYRVYSDGKVLYQALKDLPIIGKFESQLSPAQLGYIVQKANEIDYFSLNSFYPKEGKKISVFSSTLSSLNLIDKAHAVYNNFDAPLALRQFEKEILTLLQSLSLKKL